MTYLSNDNAMSKKFAWAIGIFAVAIGLTPAGSAVAQQEPKGVSFHMADKNRTTFSTNKAAMLTRARDMGKIPIIVGLSKGFTPEGGLSATEAAHQRKGLAAMQAQMVGALESPSNVRSLETIPFMSMTVSPEDLSRIMNMPGVTSVQEDVPVPPALGESVPVTKAHKLWQKGHRGSGMIVAVLDTGIRADHIAFRDPSGSKLAASACYSTTNSISNTLCPNGREKQLNNANGSAAPDCDRFSVSGCGHGTHVAAIAAGYQGSNFGVAQRAKIIPVQVFSRFENPLDCGGNAPCVLSWTSDQILALEQVYKWRQKGRPIASVNMSLGGGFFTSPCDDDPRTAIIENLKSIGVATVIASGNNGTDSAVGAPSCISAAVNVGSTTNQDELSPFSNINQMSDLLAPGSDIFAADSESDTRALRSLSGTSMATPHVAGAFALLKSAVPNASVDQVERALKCTGYQVSRNNTPKPRIWLNEAYDYLKQPHLARTFDFNTRNHVKEMNEILGNWRHVAKFQAMRVVADRNQEWYYAQAPFCANDIRVTAELRRIDTSDVGYYSGIILSSTANPEGHFTGISLVFSVAPDGTNYANIRQFESFDGKTGNGNSTSLCFETFIGKPLGTKRNIVAEKQGNSLTLKIDGQIVCTAQTDTRFADGHAGVIMAAPSGDSSHRLDVHKIRFTALETSSTFTAVSSSPMQEINAANGKSGVATAVPDSRTGVAQLRNANRGQKGR